MLVGILPDQHYARGIEVSFFGRMCRVNPLPALLAGTGKWPVYAGYATRLPIDGIGSNYRATTVSSQTDRRDRHSRHHEGDFQHDRNKDSTGAKTVDVAA